MCQKESVGFPGLEQIGTYVWGCGNGYCDHGPSKPKMTVYHVIWLIRIRIKGDIWTIDSNWRQQWFEEETLCLLALWSSAKVQEKTGELIQNNSGVEKVQKMSNTCKELMQSTIHSRGAGRRLMLAGINWFPGEVCMVFELWRWTTMDLSNRPKNPFSSSGGDLFFFRSIPTAVKWKSDL